MDLEVQGYNMEHFYEKIKGWSSETDQGALLKKILEILNKEEIVIAEIGVYMGRCTAMWNVELINQNIKYKYYAIDHFEGSSEHNKNIDYYGETKKNIEIIKENVNLIKNDSLSESKNYPDGFFDVVYIDASHDYESVKKDIETWYSKVKSGGIICGDDYTDGWPGVKKAVNEVFKNKITIVGRQQWMIKK
jgi:predicted O-methyltransferase YrrM